MALEPHEEDMFAKLRATFLKDLHYTARAFIDKLDNEGRKLPSTLQEIPPLAKELMESAGIPNPDETYKLKSGEVRDYKNIKPAEEIVKLGMELAKESNLLREGMDLPLRRVWYSFIKALLERGLKGYVYSKGKQEGEQREADAADYYSGFADIIKNSADLWYSDYGVKNTGKLTFVPSKWKLFEPIMIGVEKTSYFEVLENMCNLLGLGLYASGGESSVSASEEIMKRIDPLMKEGDHKHLNIYTITDFDPAGYDIARNIYEHSKLFIDRLGGDASFERLAPLPKQYTDTELEQGLYTMKGVFKREHQGYDNINLLPNEIPVAIDAIEEREAEGNIKFAKDDKGRYIQGLEIESLPEEPLEELLNNPPSEMPHSYSGIARMRFIIFDDLIERHGLDTALGYLLNLRVRGWTNYTGDELAENIINTREPDRIEISINDAYREIYNIKNDISEWVREYLEEERAEVAEQIDLWVDDVIEKYTNINHNEYDEDATQDLKDLIRDKIYEALARNNSSISFDFPEEFSIGKVKNPDGDYYPEDFEIMLPEEFVENIRPIVNWARCIKLNAETVKEYIEDLEKPLEEEWEIPPVRGCKIGENDEITLIESTEEEDCAELRKKYDELERKSVEKEIEYRNLFNQIHNKNQQIHKNELQIYELEQEIKRLKESGNNNEKLRETEEKLKECEREKQNLHNRINQNLTKIDSIEDDLSKCRTEKNVLLARIRNLEKKVPGKPKIVMLGQEIDLEKLKEEEEEKPYWRTIQARQQAEAFPSLPEGFSNPWAHIDWDVIISDDRGIPVLETQADLMERYISEDEVPKKKVAMEELKKFRTLIDELKTYPPKTPRIYNRLMQIHSELNRIVRVLEKMHK